MPEKISDRTIFSLSEVTRSIQKTLSERYTRTFWVKAEMNRLNRYPQSGHCYPDLVEKLEGKIVAEIRSTIWKDDFQRINDNFLKVLHEPLKSGINILFCAKISYNPVHGLSLSIVDIDPSYSLGELEKEKQLTIEKIRQEGIFNANKSLKPELLLKRIAIISVDTSKGYSDFRAVLDGNEWGYQFFHMLFPSLLQGEHAVESILGQLDRIRKVICHFDAVAIIRGGGGDVGLTCYNHYELSRAVALFPIPVITGIGHSTNETVAEMIAYKNAITPTELADYLIQRFHNFSVPLGKAQEFIIERFSSRMREEKLRVLNAVRYFKSVTIANLAAGRSHIQHELSALAQQTDYLVKRRRHDHALILSGLQKNNQMLILRCSQHISQTAYELKKEVISFLKAGSISLGAIEKNVDLVDPKNVLNRGYSITLVNGRVLKSAGDTFEGTILKTILADGEIISVAKTINKTDQP